MTDIRTKQVEDVRGSGIYPATGPFPAGPAVVRSPAALAHPEERDVVSTSRQSLETAALIAGRVIFGPEEVEPILGVTTLESAGLTVDPTTQQLKRLPAVPLK